MKTLSLSRLVFAVGLVGGCSATGNGSTGPGLRGMLDESGGKSSFSTGGAALGGTGSGGKTGGSTGFSTGGNTNGFGASGGTPLGSGGQGSGGVSFGSGGVTGSGGMLATGGSNNTGGVNNAQGGSLGSGGTTTGGATTGGTTTGGTTTGGTGTGGKATGGTSTGGASTGGTGGGASSGLIGYWKFDEASGTTAADSSITNNNTLTLGGTAGCATLGTAGKLGKRLLLGKGTPLANSCSGVASKASVNLGTLTTVTVALWVKMETGDPAFSYTAGLLDFDQVMTLIWDYDTLFWGAGQAECSSPVTGDGMWHHIAATWDSGSRDVRLFLDGAEICSGFNAVSLGGAHKLSVGKNTLGADGFVGGIDDVRIYNRILSASEITALAQ